MTAEEAKWSRSEVVRRMPEVRWMDRKAEEESDSALSPTTTQRGAT
jgi:hypothetical protein